MKNLHVKSKFSHDPAGALEANEELKRNLRRRIAGWFRRNRRDLPWRKKYRPYEVWVSEIMLQQTRMETVLPYYSRWMERFPNLEALARASQQAVLKAWEGLGYYSRGRNLHSASRIVMARWGGDLPDDPRLLRQLPGIGRYTAGAIASIAYNRAEPAVDGNVARVLSRLIALDNPWRGGPGQSALWDLARVMAPVRGARIFNQGLMELGALVCRPREPRCGRCPIRMHCLAHAQGEPERYPVTSPKRQRPVVRGVLAVVERGGKWLIRRRPEGGLWGGLWEFPWDERRPGESPSVAARRVLELAGGNPGIDPLMHLRISHGLTHKILKLDCLHYRLPREADETLSGSFSGNGTRWMTQRELAGLPLAGIAHKTIAKLQSDGMW